jgi:predicted AlkP superfamily phosphohydrolase/phosphomutase
MTYPASELDGYMVTGFDSPLRGAHLAYPSNLLQEWAASGHAYRILEDEIALMDQQNPHQQRGDLNAFVQKWVKLTIEQGQFIRWLWQERAVPLLFTVFTGTDSINHRTRDFELIARVYEAADEALGTILAAVDEDTLVCLVSDHGSTPALRYIGLYRALADAGWLHFRPQVAGQFWKRLPSPLGQLSSSIWRHLPDLARQAVSWPLLQLDPRLAVAYKNIDWTKTTVYARSGMGDLYFNRAGREPAGIVSEEMAAALSREVKSVLLALKDGQGESLFDWVKDGSEIYPGADGADDPPDLVFQHARETDHVITGFTTDPLVREIPEAGEYGTHTPDGIFVVAGPGVRADLPLQRADIVDVVPTLLAASGLPIPENVDGEARVDLFSEPVVPQFAPAAEAEQRAAEDATEGADEVMERLRNLGYL